MVAAASAVNIEGVAGILIVEYRIVGTVHYDTGGAVRADCVRGQRSGIRRGCKVHANGVAVTSITIERIVRTADGNTRGVRVAGVVAQCGSVSGQFNACRGVALADVINHSALVGVIKPDTRITATRHITARDRNLSVPYRIAQSLYGQPVSASILHSEVVDHDTARSNHFHSVHVRSLPVQYRTGPKAHDRNKGLPRAYRNQGRGRRGGRTRFNHSIQIQYLLG